MQALEHLAQYLELGSERELSSADATEDRAVGLALQVFHRDEGASIVLADFVGVDDVRVVESGGDARLRQEHGERVSALRHVVVQDLDDQQLGEVRQA